MTHRHPLITVAATAIAVGALTLSTTGTASADPADPTTPAPAPVVDAPPAPPVDPVPVTPPPPPPELGPDGLPIPPLFADVERTQETLDHYTMTARKLGEESRLVVPISNNNTARESFFSVIGQAEVSGQGDVPLLGAKVSVFLNVGCMVNFNGATVQAGASSTTTGTGNLGLTEGGSLAGTAAGNGSSSGGGGSGSVTVTGNVGASQGASLSEAVGINGSVTSEFQAGDIITIPLAEKTLVEPTASIALREVHLGINDCIGPAQYRIGVTVSTSTARTDDSTTVYSRPVNI